MTRFQRCAVLSLSGASLVFWTTAASAFLHISKKATANVSCSAGVCAATAKQAVLNVSDLANMLASGDVTVQSGNLAQDIEIDAPLTWASTSRLTLDSYRSITFNRPVIVAGTGALTITTNDGGAGGDYAFVGKGHVEFWDENSDLNINGGSFFLVKNMRALVHAGNRRGGDNIALMRNINAGGTTYGDAPIGDYGGWLEGLGNTISNLTVNNSLNSGKLGLMRSYSPDFPLVASIRDIRLKNFQITGTGSETKAGTLMGQSLGGSVHDVHVSESSVSSTGVASEAGGLIGDAAAGTTSGSDSAAVISVGNNSSAGGLIGTQEQFGTPIDRSFATGAVSGGDNSKVGGLVGENIGAPITNSYATGSVSVGNSSQVGGLVGANEEGNIPPSIGTSYSTGTVTGGIGALVGGSLGADVADSSISDLYWDLDTSGISDPSQGAGNVSNDHGITGVSDSQLKSALPAGFDRHVWGQDPSINNGYPYLLGNAPQ